MTCHTSQLGPLSRRQVLQAGAALGLSLPRLFAAQESARGKSTLEKSCIVIFQYGGLSQLDSWDPKPNGPSETRAISND